MIKRIVQFSFLFAVCFHTGAMHRVSGQDMSTLVSVARANGECLNNYDVSYRIVSIADVTKDPSKLEELKRTLKEKNRPLIDERRVTARLVLDKASTVNPVKFVFVVNYQSFRDEKIVSQVTEFMAWQDGLLTDGTTMNPSGEITRRRVSLERCYQSFGIPSFETFYGALNAPNDRGYWENHDIFWDSYQSALSDCQLTRLKNGRLRVEKSFPAYRSSSEFDPISSLMVNRASVLIDRETGADRKESTTTTNVAWENFEGIYRIRNIFERMKDLGTMGDRISTYHWHQFNEEKFEFPIHILKDISLENCTQFLLDGQSELSSRER
ncbi:hypothetical protein SH449x_005195 [Pirellulaceae bacterium SH449]